MTITNHIQLIPKSFSKTKRKKSSKNHLKRYSAIKRHLWVHTTTLDLDRECCPIHHRCTIVWPTGSILTLGRGTRFLRTGGPGWGPHRQSHPVPPPPDGLCLYPHSCLSKRMLTYWPEIVTNTPPWKIHLLTVTFIHQTVATYSSQRTIINSLSLFIKL